MKILFVVHKALPTSVGGTEVYTDQVARCLAKDHQLFVFCGDETLSQGTFAEVTRAENGFTIHRVASPPSSNPVGQFWATFQNSAIEASFRRFLDQVQPDIVHFQHIMGLSVNLIRIVRERRLPVVVTLHDYWFMCSNSQLIWPDQRCCPGKAAGMNCVRCATVRVKVPLLPVARPLIAPLFLYRDHKLKQAVLQADCLIAPSHFLMEQYVAYGLPAERFLYLENGIDVERIQGFPRTPGSGPLRVTYIGSVAWQKGVHILAEAFREIPPDQATLHVYGDPTVFPSYAENVQHLLDRPNTYFCGRVANDRVGQVLAETDVVVVPSLWYENSPVVIQEAFAAKVPVVTSRLGAMAEKVQHGVNGLLFQPADFVDLRRTLLCLAEDRALLQRLASGIQPVKSVAENSRVLATIYDRLVLEHGTTDEPR